MVITIRQSRKLFLQSLACQGLALVIVLFIQNSGLVPIISVEWIWLLGQGLIAAIFSMFLRQPSWWFLIHAVFPLALSLALRLELPPWIWLLLLIAFLVIFGGGLGTRVPLYNSNRHAWESVEQLLPTDSGLKLLDLGAGLGGLQAYLASRHPQQIFVGVEASLMTWFLAWLRNFPLQNSHVRLGNFWNIRWSEYQVVYAFLSPAPMPEVWQKATAEMAPGSLLISNTFGVPNHPADQVFDLEGRSDACLHVWHLK